MRAAIRLAVCLVLGASSMAASAGGSDPTSAGDDLQNVNEGATRTDSNATTQGDEKGNVDIGAASGEPMRSDARGDTGLRAGDDATARGSDEARRQQEVWTGP